MKILGLLKFMGFLGMMVGTSALLANPYESIRRHKLKNGLTVVLAPSGSSKHVEAEMRVLTGWSEEKEENLGAAQLVVHALFRDPNLRFSQTYLQRIGDVGGEIRGSNKERSTSIFVSVPSIKGIWILNELASIFMLRNFSSEDLEKARTELLLKLGEPNNFLQRMFSKLIPTVSQANFFETEFKVSNERGRNLDQVRRSIRKLTLKQVQDFYNKYYHSNNMVLFLAGPYKRDLTLSFINETFEQYASVEVPKVKTEERVIYPRNASYIRSRVANRDSKISIGTKFWDVTPEEEITLRVYFKYLAHRIMRSLRNEHGETYRAKSEIWVGRERYGYAIVTFDTPRQHYKKNLNFVRGLLYQETLDGDLSDTNIQKAKIFYTRYADLIDSDANDNIGLASRLYAFQKKYKTEKNPYDVFSEISNEEFRQNLRGLFHPQKEYLSLEEPPVSFRGESIILYLIAVTLAIAVAQKYYLNSFDNTRIRYVKKIKYSPVVITILTVGFFNVLWLVGLITSFLDHILLGWNLYQSTFLMSQYLQEALNVFLVLLASLTYLCLIPRKVIVTDKHLYIKSISYASRKIDILNVRDIFICRPQHLFSHRLWNLRLRMSHWTPWKRGILIRLEDGSGYFVSFHNTPQVAQELREVLRTRPQLIIHDAA